MSNDTSERATQHRASGRAYFHNTLTAVAIVTVAVLLAGGVASMTYGKWVEVAFYIGIGRVMFLAGLGGMGVLGGMVIRR